MISLPSPAKMPVDTELISTYKTGLPALSRVMNISLCALGVRLVMTSRDRVSDCVLLPACRTGGAMHVPTSHGGTERGWKYAAL